FSGEYPNHQGIGCNIVGSDDTANFLSSLQGLHKDSTGSNITAWASVYLKPIDDSNGNPQAEILKKYSSARELLCS
ncbi:hypothetical protein M405DRAFT_752498, partial [Rhizopogon salebrosus TDB-379]